MTPSSGEFHRPVRPARQRRLDLLVLFARAVRSRATAAGSGAGTPRAVWTLPSHWGAIHLTV